MDTELCDTSFLELSYEFKDVDLETSLPGV